MAEAASPPGTSPERDTDAARPLLEGTASAPAQNYQSVPHDPSIEIEGSSPARRNSLGENRQAFQANRQDEVRRAGLHRDTWRTPLGFLMMFIGFILLVVPPCVIIYIEVMSWNIYLVYGDKPCDQTLGMWLLIRNVMSLTSPRLPPPDETDLEVAERQRSRARMGATLYTAWLIVGYVWIGACRTCQHTNPHLYDWVRFLTIFGLAVHFLMTFFPIVFVLIAMSYHGMVSRGWIKSPNAASDHAIERLEQIAYSADVFREGAEQEGGPPHDCCCCMEQFGAEKIIVVTPCRHYFHHECLKEWLRLSKTCPLCRADLDIEQV